MVPPGTVSPCRGRRFDARVRRAGRCGLSPTRQSTLASRGSPTERAGLAAGIRGEANYLDEVARGGLAVSPAGHCPLASMTWDTDGTLVDLTRQRARSATAARGYTFVSGTGEPKARLSFAELDLRARAVAVELGRVARPGSRALLHYEPGLDFLVGFFGCLYAGVIAVPAAPLEGTLGGLRDRSPVARDPAQRRPRRRAHVLCRRPPGSRAARGVGARPVSPGWTPTWWTRVWRRAGRPRTSTRTPWPTCSTPPDPQANPRAWSSRTATCCTTCGSSRELLEVDEDTHGCFWLPMFHDMGLVSGGTHAAPRRRRRDPHGTHDVPAAPTRLALRAEPPPLRDGRAELRLRPLRQPGCPTASARPSTSAAGPAPSSAPSGFAPPPWSGSPGRSGRSASGRRRSCRATAWPSRS